MRTRMCLFLAFLVPSVVLSCPSLTLAALFSGRVYEGSSGDESTPLPGVSVSLYGSADSGGPRTQIDSTTTDSSGWYGLSGDGYEYYWIVAGGKSGYTLAGSSSVGGSASGSEIAYDTLSAPLSDQTLTGNRFWYKKEGQESPPPSQNRAPVAVDDFVSTTASLCIIIDALANDSDPDGDLLVRQGYTQPSHGVVGIDPFGYVYCPDAGFTGTDTFDYTISDGNGGTDTATVTVTVLAPSQDAGTLNGYKRDADTNTGLANWKIYVDQNLNGQWDSGEPYDLTDSTGHYEIPNLEGGTYRVCEVMQAGWEPASGTVCVDGVTIVAGTTTTQDFHNRRTTAESGSVVIVKEASPQDDTGFLFCANYAAGGFFDTLCQTLRDPSDNQLSLSNLDLLETVTETVASGWTLTDITITGDTDNGSVVDLANATVDVDFDEGENIVIVFKNEKTGAKGDDFGDAPGPYPTASHDLGGSWLGDQPPDAEMGTLSNPPGLGDDITGTDDEDGAQFLSELVPGQPFGVSWKASVNGSAVMAGWIDFNRDGDWDDPGEYLGGTACKGCQWMMMTIKKPVPAGFAPGKTYARFRVFEGLGGGGLTAPSGYGGPGEVEDYEVEIKLEGAVLPPGEIVGGVKFNDANGNKVFDTGEQGLANWTVWIDLNANGVKDAGEDTLTNPDGTFYFMALSPGTYTVHEEMKPGWIQTCPGGAGTQTITVQAGQSTPSILFGNQQTGAELSLDWGDAPDPTYPTLRASNGAYHTIVPGVFLGGGVDAEVDGQPKPNAQGDDSDGNDDEDGVTFLTPLIPGQQASVEVMASVGYLDAWIDFGADGSWSQSSDQIFHSKFIVAAGSYVFSFQVPLDAALDVDTYARFRLSSAGGLGPDGPAQDGEVEDYHIFLGAEGPGVPGVGQAEPHVKWSQPPVEVDPNPEVPPVFCGWDEPARSTHTEGSRRQWRMDADDFRCLGPMPVTAVRWWGGYKAWTAPEPPAQQPEAWHIGFWANQVEGLESSELYPERLVWVLEVPNDRVGREPLGLAEVGAGFPEMCFVYRIELEPGEWFRQAQFTSNEDVFWISITAIYPTGAEPINQWGWMTRPHLWGRGAVMPAIMGEWPTLEERLFPGRIYPVEGSAMCGDRRACDLCFQLFTGPLSIKWDQPFAGIRDWPWYADEMAEALEAEDEELLVLREVADDWACERQDPVVAISWHGSYLGYGYEPSACIEVPEPRRPDYFLLSLSTSARPDDEQPYEHPGERVWEYVAHAYDEVLVGYDKDPAGEPNEPVFRYSVRLPEEAWFRQPALETVYWFSVVPVFEEPIEDRLYHWGWTNHPHVFGSGATFIDYRVRMVPRWQPVQNALEEMVDMSFTLYTTPQGIVE